MSKILGIDYGKKRTGIAITDSLKIFSLSLDTIPSTKLMIFLEKIIFKEKIDEIVIGLPKKFNNKNFPIEKEIKNLIFKIHKNYPKLIIKRIDERFTTKIALRSLIELKLKKRKNKNIINKISATIILQSYLQNKKK
jgi:putative Holliday junction resolvase